MTKRKDKSMDVPDDMTDSSVLDGASVNNHAAVFMPHMLPSGLKPKLDLIFSEVEKKLPDIDFDCSDVDSDTEEPMLFHQHLKSLPVEEDKDLDTSQSSESLAELAYINQSVNSNITNTVSNNMTPMSDSMQFYDNDLAYQLQRTDNVSSWNDIAPAMENDKNKNAEKSISTSTSTNTITSWTNIPQDNDTPDSNVLNEERSQQDLDGLSLNSLDDKLIRKQLGREQTRNKEKDMATNIVSPRGPVLSTNALDNIDLDTYLQNLNNDNQFGPPAPRQAARQAWSDTRRSDNGAGERPAKDKNSENLTLIQKLAQLSMGMCGEDLSAIDPSTGAVKKVSHNNEAPSDNMDDDVDDQSEVIEDKCVTQEKAAPIIPNFKGIDQFLSDIPSAKSAIKKTEDVKEDAKVDKKVTFKVSCGTNTRDFTPRVLTARARPPIPPKLESGPEKKDKEPTVFIDLRNFDQIRQEQQQSIERVQKVLGINPAQSQTEGTSDSDDDVEDWRNMRQKMKQQSATGTRPTTSSAGGKKYKPRSTSHPQPPRVINMSDLPPRMIPTEQSTTTPVTEEDREEQRKRQMEQREKERRAEIVKKLRDQRESELQTKLRLQKRLDALHPSASVSGRQDPAEATSTIFDLEASYEPAPRNLPPVLSQDTDTVLLTIHLSSNGEIVLHRGSGNKSVDTGKGLSASYTTLLTWLLALVPSNFTYLHDGATPTQISPFILPFYVVGLQQVLMDDQQCLLVAVTPVEQFDAKYVSVKSKKSKKNAEVKGSQAFQQHLSKYLSTNTLHNVCPWLQNMVSMDVAPMGEAEQTPGYTYTPPLPNITNKPLSTFMHINPDPQAATKVFNTSVGFFWQTVDSDEPRLDQDIHDDGVNYDTQTTISLVYKKIYQEPSAMMGILNRVLQLGLDLAGVRLVYPTSELMNLPKTDNAAKLSEMDLLNNVGAVLAICLRGTAARSLWLDTVGPSDPSLARRTDPNSLCALYGGESRDECLLFCPRTPARVQTEIARWFGGRVPPGNVIDVGTPYTKKDTLRSGSPKGRRSKKVTFSDTKDSNSAESVEHHRPLATLTATTKSEIFLILSPLVPPKCFGIVMASCQRRGYQVSGIKRTRLSSKRAAALGICGSGMKSFCPGSCSELEERVGDIAASHLDRQTGQREAEFPSTILQLLKENASHSAASLVEDCMVQLTLQGIMGTIQKGVSFPLESVHMFHAARYSDALLTSLGGEFSKCYDPEIQINPSYVIPQLYTNPELEQVTVLLMLGHDVLKTSGLFVGKLVNLVPYSKSQQTVLFPDGLELLGMKWLAGLTSSQAKEVTPCEVGDRTWKESLHTLITEPCQVLALRGVNVFKKLESVVPPRPNPTKAGQSYHLDMLHARTAEEAYTFIRLFFMERELFADPLSRPMLPYIPQYYPTHMEGHTLERKGTKHGQSNQYEESIFEIMLSGPRPITTFMLIKPRALQRHMPKILKKLSQEGFKIAALRLQVLTEGQADHFISKDAQNDEKSRHLTYLTSGPCLLLSVQRENAVKMLLDLLGPEDPQSARRQSQFYWRGVFGADTVTNAIYGSKTYIDSVTDQQRYFPDGLCCQENDVTIQEQIPCPCIDSELDIKFMSHRETIVQTVQENAPVDSLHVLLQQTSCIVLTPMLMKKLGSHYGYVDVIDGLVSQGFEIVGARMVWFTQEQAEHFLCLVDAGNFHQVPLMVSGASIVLALQRDNAVVAFDTILRETLSTETIQGKAIVNNMLQKYGRLILRPTDVKQAHSCLGFFFDHLLPTSQVQVVPKMG